MFESIKHGFNKAKKRLGGLFQTINEAPPTRNEMSLEAVEWTIKRKLGRSFFTRQLNKNTRALRIATLTPYEHQIARSKGWIGSH